MSTYQLECLDSIVKESLIPEELDILVINASLQTGVNIKNKDIDWVLVNSTNETTQVQARSRVRKDIEVLFLKTNEKIKINEILLDDKWLNRPLTSKDKQELSIEVGIFDERGRLIKWKGLSKQLIGQGYSINNYSIRIKSKITRVSIISKK